MANSGALMPDLLHKNSQIHGEKKQKGNSQFSFFPFSSPFLFLQALYDAYAGDKNYITFDGDHNSCRPHFFYTSVTIFMHNALG